MSSYTCSICNYIYDETAGLPTQDLPPGTLWKNLPDNWTCPICGAAKDAFLPGERQIGEMSPPISHQEDTGELRALTPGELSAVFSNLAKGSEKQNLIEESGLFQQLADYYRAQTPPEEKEALEDFLPLLEQDLDPLYPGVETAATGAGPDRGALRASTWGGKVSRILKSILLRYQKEGAALLQNNKVFVCEICGFLYLGAQKPEICPVCKVPSLKIQQLQRRS